MDFAQKGSKDYIVIACALTGFLKVYEVKNKGSAESILKLREWGACFGLPYQVKCNFGPGFRESFEDGMKQLGVSVIHSMAFNYQSNDSHSRILLNQVKVKYTAMCSLHAHTKMF